MARWEFKLPDLGEGVSEGELVAWLVKPGDTVKEDQPIVEVMTDKATVTITSPRDGSIVETRGKVGEIAHVHAVLVVYELGGSPAVEAEPVTERGAEKPAEAGAAATAVGDIRETLPGMSGSARIGAPRPAASAEAAVPPRAASVYFADKPLATPATRKLARDLDVDLRRVPPTGPGGRVTKDDVRAFAGQGGQPQQAPPETAIVPVPPQPRRPAPPGREERVPFAGLRRRIAQKMAQSTRTAAHFTFVEECDVSRLMALRANLQPAAVKAGVSLSYLPFIVKAVVGALRRHPLLNSTLDEAASELVYRRYYNIGVAVSTEAGLIVPVVKDADGRGLLDIAREIERLATDARAGKLKIEDVTGSTFTVSSLGAQGGLFATPIINYPEVGILGVHRIKETPVVRDGQLAIGQVMFLSLSFDHRVVDGHVAAAFAYDVIGALEAPEPLLLGTG